METEESTQANLIEAGFRFGDKGTHTSRTMMLAELTELLEAIPETAPRQAYAEAIIEDNLLGKQTTATRKLTTVCAEDNHVFDDNWSTCEAFITLGYRHDLIIPNDFTRLGVKCD